jgi:hypothetical protein
MRVLLGHFWYGERLFVEKGLCLNIELSIVVVAVGVRFPYPFIVLFLSLCTVWLGSMEIGGVPTSCG